MATLLPIVDDPSHGPCVRRVPIFAQLTTPQQDAVAAFAHSVDVPRGALLHRAGEASRALFVVHRGKLKVTHVAASGHQRVLRVAGPGDVVGEHAFLTGEPPGYEVEALSAARVCAFGASDLAGLVARYPAIAAGMLRSLSQRLQDAERRLTQTSVDVPVRLAAFLLDLPTVPSGGGVGVVLPWPKKDVASYLGTTPESLSRALDRLQRDGAIRVEGAAVEIMDADALEALVDPQS
ncbi:Crp/Fnr family transcriptional regulator [Aestuariimicrobium sp. T2.26MG-19.2B]|uniref:Crp/Fnr family transcriptional regulator n=1 Tax=Aestuariimicrobium sp. T2.26MG-19.2B TaxID=3040679 RepID=UPI0024776D23|nr:Crp/Fnr family transcriptional regulator [Aestuariimicrobium sp. T2.26MG-19.2B]CAI9409745.1 hypothetical protein AESSP_02296 [Aestuariimicrobium sp. T2.26MG-19.2B]